LMLSEHRLAQRGALLTTIIETMERRLALGEAVDAERYSAVASELRSLLADLRRRRQAVDLPLDPSGSR
jgi:hypothetical protein